MGLVVMPNGGIAKGRSGSTATAAGSALEQRCSKNSSTTTCRKGWTLFILKQSGSCEPAPTNSPAVPLKQLPNNNYPCHHRRSSYDLQPQHAAQVKQEPQGAENRNETGTGDANRGKAQLRGLAAIVQDVLSRSLSDLRREYGPKALGEETASEISSVSFRMQKSQYGEETASEFSSMSFRMQVLDRSDTGLSGSLRNASSSSSLYTCDAGSSFRYSHRMPAEATAKIQGLLENEKLPEPGEHRRVPSNPRALPTCEYETVVERLRDQRGTIRLLAATAVREATRNSAQAREDLWRAGAIPPLVNLLQEEDMGVCYMTTVALLNLAIGSVRNKQAMADAGAIPILVRLMRPESPTSVRESATTVILSLAASDQLKPSIGLSGAIVYLVDILSNGTTQGRSDSVRALLNLSIFKGNRPMMVMAGIIGPLYKVILRDAKDTSEKSVILLSHLFGCREGRETISCDEHTCSILIQVLKRSSFSQSCKEQTVVMLLALSSKMAVRREAVFAQGILPSLVEIALLGSSPKIQEKAAKLLRIIKEHRTDEGILSMDRFSDFDDKLPLERQNSCSSTGETTTTSTCTIPPAKGHAIRNVFEKVGGNHKEGKEVKYSTKFFRSLIARSLRSEYLTCRAVSIDDSTSVPCKLFRSFCSQD